MNFPSPQELLKRATGTGSNLPLFDDEVETSGIPSPQQILKKVQTETGPSGSFISNISSTIGKVSKAVGSKIKSFVSGQAENVSDFVTGDLKVTPDDVITGLKKTTLGLGSGIDSLAKGFNEGVVRIVKSTSEGIIGKEKTAKLGNVTGASGFGELVTGKPSVTSYQDIYDKATNYALENNASSGTAQTFGGLAVIGMIFADNPAMGPGKKSVFNLTDDAIKTLAKESGDDVIKGILKKENPFLGDIELEALTPVFRNADTEDAVRVAKEQISKIQYAPLKEGSNIPAPDELLRKAEAGELPPPDVYYKKAVEPITENSIQPRSVIESTLFKEAQKAKSADEFLNSIGNKDFNIELTNILKQQVVEAGPKADLIFGDLGKIGTKNIMTDEEALKLVKLEIKKVLNDPIKFYDTAKKGKFIEAVDSKAVKIVDGLDTFVSKGPNDTYEVFEARTGRSVGGVGATEDEAIENARKALTARKIEDIQKRIADIGEVSPRYTPKVQEATPAVFSPNLVKSLSMETLPGPIADILQREFPAMSRTALDIISNRLSKLKRTRDIEGILTTIKKVNSDIEAGRKLIPPKKLGALMVDDQEILPGSAGELLSQEERGRYLDNLTKAIKNPEEAVLAQQEYDALWANADQKVIDKYEELQIMRDILRENVQDSGGKKVADLYKGTFKSPDDVELDELINIKGKGFESTLSEAFGTTDLKEAQKMFETYRKTKSQLKEVEAEMRELRPLVRSARILQDMVEDVPVISREKAGEISALANVDSVENLYKDISGFSGQTNDLYRNFENFFKDKFDQVKKAILDPFDKSKGEMIDELKKLGDEIEENVVKKYGIKRGGKLDIAIQRYGDSSLHEGDRWSFDRLVQEVGTDGAEKVRKAEGEFHRIYDRLIDEANKSRAVIYPNDPSKLIPKRKDYFRHFQEISDGFKGFMDIFVDPVHPDISPSLAGLSEFTKPKSKFLSFAQARTGSGTDISALGGFLDYAPAFAYMKHIDPHIGNFRYLRRSLAEVSPAPGAFKVTNAGEKFDGINNFITYLDDFANDLAGKTNPMDRYLQKIIPGGRKTFRAINWINNRVKANTILGNLSSAVSQIFHVPEGLASAGPIYSSIGAKRALASLVTESEPQLASTFLKERFSKDLKTRFPIEFTSAPIKASVNQGKEVAIWITSILDEVGTKFIWNSHYAKGLAEGVADPIKYADDITRKIVAGRGVGEVPLIQKSKIFQLVAPFQLEVGNAWRVLGGHVKKKEFGAIATILAGNYLMNRVAEKVRGSPVVFDPIQALIDGATQAHDEMENDGTATRASLKFLGRQVGELLSNVPLGQTVASALPDSLLQKAGVEGGKEELFGSANPARFGSGLIAVSGLSDPLYKLIPPFSGTQFKKTIQGVQSMLSGEVKDRNNNLSFKIDKSPLTVIQSILFGKNATKQAQEFYNERDDLFQRIYRQDANRTDLNLEAEAFWSDVKKLSKEEAVQKLQTLETENKDLADAVANVAEEEANGLTGVDRLIKMLGVDNGERAKYITDQVKNMETKEDQVKYLQYLDEKKLISDNVFEQLQLLLPDVLKK